MRYGCVWKEAERRKGSKEVRRKKFEFRRVCGVVKA